MPPSLPAIPWPPGRTWTPTTGTADLSGFTFAETLSGPSVGQYSQLDVNGKCGHERHNNNVPRSRRATFRSGTSFTLIKNNGSNPVSGTFAGLPEGAMFTVGSSIFRITYHGGGGNDVVLYALGTPTVSVMDAGGTYNGSAFTATATVAGVIPGVDTTPGRCWRA